MFYYQRGNEEEHSSKGQIIFDNYSFLSEEIYRNGHNGLLLCSDFTHTKKTIKPINADLFIALSYFSRVTVQCKLNPAGNLAMQYFNGGFENGCSPIKCLALCQKFIETSFWCPFIRRYALEKSYLYPPMECQRKESSLFGTDPRNTSTRPAKLLSFNFCQMEGKLQTTILSVDLRA